MRYIITALKNGNEIKLSISGESENDAINCTLKTYKVDKIINIECKNQYKKRMEINRKIDKCFKSNVVSFNESYRM